ncbi:MAG: protein-L-isoaspartate O-methyltransferase [Candidatus Saccharimonadales bacterium]|nr:protein-L-isoaspartate O-methyltransferase [Candidatus Saccharimonadales bacterium]
MGVVDQLQKFGVLKTPLLIEAFQKVKRLDFLPEDLRANAEADHPLPIGFGQTNSQPYTVAFMLELLELESGQQVLDVGSGSGWTTALLAQAVGKNGSVIGVERVPQLVEFGSQNLDKYKFRNAAIIQSLEIFGWPDEGPYDRILVSAEAVEIPRELIEQLIDGGVMVIPVGNSILKVIKQGKDLKTTEYPGFVFVPLI